MAMIYDLFNALWHQDFHVLIEQNLTWVIYLLLFTVIFLENGFLPTAFLPGDSLLFLTGALIANHTLHLTGTIILLIVAASLGCWVSFLQGRWLGHTRLMKRWLAQLPEHYHHKAERLFNRHGLPALIMARFFAYIRTLLPLLAGLSRLESKKFQLFNWLSALLWVSTILLLGYALAQTTLYQHYEKQIMELLMLLPIIFLVIGIGGMLWFFIKRHFAKDNA